MAYDDDEIAETGDQHEINGREYSVVGNTVYKKSFWGGWKPVEDEDEEAEGGNIVERGYNTYSVVGDKVYLKNWLGGWDEVEDDDQRAEAGEREEINGTEYSRVGDSVFKKGLFGGWRLVESADEEAEAGDHREVNGQTYSLVGNTVYKKNWLSGWDKVEDDDERAEAGDHYENNGITYSRVGDFVYEKGFFSGWTELEGIGHDEDEEEDDDDNSYSSSYSSYGSQDSTTPTSSISSYEPAGSPFSSLSVFVLGIIVVAALVYFGMKRYQPNNNVPTTMSQPVPQHIEPVRSSNPYGEGNGQIGFYKTCTYCADIEVSYDGMLLGVLKTEPLENPPSCGGPYTLQVIAAVGARVFTMKDQNGNSWEQTINVIEGECITEKVIQPPTTDTVAEPLQENNTTAFELTTPQDHSEYDYPRHTTVSWPDYPNTVYYIVELQLANEPYDYTATNYSPMPYNNGGIYNTTEHSITVQGMGKQVHRVRVKALVATGVIVESPWRYFNYIN